MRQTFARVTHSRKASRTRHGSQAKGSGLAARDADTPLAFVESVYSLGEWISPHRLHSVDDLFWHTDETDAAKGLYRCRSGYVAPGAQADAMDDDDEPDFD